jgi:hypothetical protein
MTVNPDKAHKAIPVEGSLRISTDKRFATVSTCKWCGRDIIEKVSQFGNAGHMSHLPGAFKS